MNKINLAIKLLLIGASFYMNTLRGQQQKSHSNLIYLNQGHLEKAKVFIEKKDTYFTQAFNQLIEDANKELSKSTNPVTNKTQINMR